VVDAWLAADVTLRASVIHERLVADYGFVGHYQRSSCTPPKPASGSPPTARNHRPDARLRSLGGDDLGVVDESVDHGAVQRDVYHSRLEHRDPGAEHHREQHPPTAGRAEPTGTLR
jgi:hypothetical protein